MPIQETETQTDTRKCPHCAEQIKAEAVFCKHCRRSTEPASRAPWIAGLILLLLVAGFAAFLESRRAARFDAPSPHPAPAPIPSAAGPGTGSSGPAPVDNATTAPAQQPDRATQVNRVLDRAQVDDGEFRRNDCLGRLRAALAPSHIEVGAQGVDIYFKTPQAGGLMIDAFQKAGAFDMLATYCAFQAVAFYDGAYFSARWSLPLKPADLGEIAIIANHEHQDAVQAATTQATVHRFSMAMRSEAWKYNAIRDCAAAYPTDAAAFETCRQSVIAREQQQ